MRPTEPLASCTTSACTNRSSCRPSLDAPGQRLRLAAAPAGADQLAQLAAVNHIAGANAQHQVTGAQAGAFGRATGHQLAQHRARPGADDANPAKQVCIGLAHLQLVQRQHQLALGRATLWLELQAHALAIEGATRERPAQILKRAHGLEVTLAQGGAKHQLAPVQTRLLRDGAGHRAGQHGLGLVHPTPVDGGIQQHSQQQVGQRPRGDDGRARAQRLGVEGQMAIFSGDGCLALVEHAHIAAERKRTDDEFCRRALALPAQQRPAKAHREAQHLHAAGHGHTVVAVLVHGYQYAQCDDKGDDGEHAGASLKKHSCWRLIGNDFKHKTSQNHFQ